MEKEYYPHTGRYNFLDILRGMTLISMILYHGCWDLVYIKGIEMKWYMSDAAFIWQQSICWTFILLSGFCWSFGRHKLKRGVAVIGASFLVTAVTVLFTPESRIVFGVLSAIGTAMLLMIPLDKALHKVNAIAGAAAAFILFCITRNLNKGTMLFGMIDIPGNWYSNYLTAYLGMPPESFFSTDYFPMIPWVFLFITGYFVNMAMTDKNVLHCRKMKAIEFMGRHSLVIYLLHQPILLIMLHW